MKIAEVMDQIRRSSGNTVDMMALKSKLDSMGIFLENIYQELEMNSSYVDSHRDISTAGERVQPHSHSFFELILCCACSNVQYLLGSQRYRLQKGDVLLIPPGISHCPLFPESMETPYERIVVWVNAEFLLKIYQKWPEMSADVDRRSSHYLLRTGGSCWEAPIAESFARGCMESERRNPGWEAALCGNTMLLVTQILRALRSGQSRPHSEPNSLLDSLLTYVETHLTEKITIRSTARHLLVSESTITHLCKKQLGISFYRYVIQQRLIAAKTMIEQGLVLEEVGIRAGFADYSTFYRAFKQEYGISPRQYRKVQESGRL